MWRIRERFRPVFYKEGEPLTATGKVMHSIELTDNRPVYGKPYRQPYAKLYIIRQQLAELKAQGKIRDSFLL